MKIKLFIFLLFSSSLCFSQIWINDLDQAKKLAKTTNKLIILDFNASWCKPCKVMETEYWYNKEYKASLDSFIAVPIDIDANKSLASYYSVSSIPNVKVIDYNGDVIHEALGFTNARTSDDDFGGFPANVSMLYENLEFKDAKKPTDEELLTLGSSYQGMIQKSKNIQAKRAFSVLSNKYFNKCIKETKNQDFTEKSNLAKAFNSVLTDSPKRAIKAIDPTKISALNKGFALYILLNASYAGENKEEAEKWLAEIEKTGEQNWISNAQKLKTKYSK